MTEVWAIHGFLGDAFDWLRVRQELAAHGEFALTAELTRQDARHLAHGVGGKEASLRGNNSGLVSYSLREVNRNSLRWHALNLFPSNRANSVAEGATVQSELDLVSAPDWPTWTARFLATQIPIDPTASPISQQHVDQHQVEVFGADALATLPTKPRRLLIGYSLGGRLALQIFLAAPQLWDQVVVIAGHPGLSSPEEQQLRLQQDQRWAARFEDTRNEAWAPLLAEWNSQPVLRESLEVARPEENFSRAALAKALDIFSLGRQPLLNPPTLQAHKDKLTWMVGENDDKFRLLYQSLAQSGIIRPPLIIKGAGHRVLADAPEEVAAGLISVLQKVLAIYKSF